MKQLTMQQNKWQVDADGFTQAVANDEYAELVLETGDVLITDWEGDGVFNPYVETTENNHSIDRDTKEAQIMRAIAKQLDCRVDTIEYDKRNDVFVPYMDRPDQ